MNDSFEQKKNKYLVKTLFWIMGIGIGILFFKVVLPWIMPFLLAFAAARLLNPLIEQIERKTKWNRQILSSVLVLLTYSILGAAVWYLISYLITELIGFLNILPQHIGAITEMLEKMRHFMLSWTAHLPKEINGILASFWDAAVENLTVSGEQISILLSKLTDFAFSLPNVLLFLITMVISTFLISADYKKITRFLSQQIPEKRRIQFYRTKEHLSNTLLKWIKALFILLGITFVELCIGFFLLRIDHTFVLAAVVSLVDLLPILGVGSVLIPWAIYELFIGNQIKAVSLAVLYGVISLIRNICEPKIIGSQIGLHPLITLICVYVGYKTLGFTGILLFPIAAITLQKFQEWGYIRLFKLSREN